MPLRRPARSVILLLAFLLSLVLSLQPWVSHAAEPIDRLLQQSRERYEAGQWDVAKTLLQQVQQQAQATGNTLVLAVSLSNLALIEQKQGNSVAANQAIADSLRALQGNALVDPDQKILAQVLTVQGQLQLAQGNAQAALQTWEQTEKLYRQINNPQAEIQSQLRQAQALQALGLYDRVYRKLQPLQQSLPQQPDSATKAWGLRSLSVTVGILKNMKEAQKLGRASLEVAERLENPQEKAQEVAASQMTLANLLAAKVRETRKLKNLRTREKELLQQETEEAIRLYQAVAASPSPNRLRAQLNQFALLIESSRLPEASQVAEVLQPQIWNLPTDRPAIEARLNFANSWLKLQKATDNQSGTAILSLLQTTVKQAEALNDPRLLANVLGNLAHAQEQNQQLAAARSITERALMLATETQAQDQIYRWAAQLGRLQEQEGNRQGAIGAYWQAVNALKLVQRDLIGLTAEAQLIDSGAFEPVHRQLVNLLLPDNSEQADAATVRRARDIIESLQVEEISNYLRMACTQVQAIDTIGNVSRKTAIIYPIVLKNRIAIITNAIGENPQLFTKTLPDDQVKTTVESLQKGLRNRISLEYQDPARKLYQWLIEPIVPKLQQEKIETLVFVLDGVLRNIPMAALMDGDQFLIEKYSIAVAPGLTLTKPEPLQAKTLSGVAFGLSEASKVQFEDGGSQVFSPLPNVNPELKVFQEEIQPSIVKVDKDFTGEQFRSVLEKSQAPIVHLATHGQFSSNLEQTFLVASDGAIDTNLLTEALGANEISRTTPIELLVLSACETAKGDDRAPLGLAGIALKSGARSTIASLWKVNDTATSVLMQRFYQELATRQMTKAEALQRAQREILDNPEYRRHPYYWSPFILVGNWL